MNHKDDIVETLLGRLLLPGVVGRQVEFAGAARDDGAASNAHQPFIVAHVLPGLALRGDQGAGNAVEFGEDGVQHFGLDIRVGAVAKQALALALEFLQEVGFEVGTPGHFKHVEDGGQCDVMLHRVFLMHEELEFLV